jgi:hypothetical protein
METEIEVVVSSGTSFTHYAYPRGHYVYFVTPNGLRVIYLGRKPWWKAAVEFIRGTCDKMGLIRPF